MPDDAEKPQVLGLQFQRTILYYFLKFTNTFVVLFRNFVEIDDIDLAGLLNNVSDLLQGDKHMHWLTLGKCCQKELDEFSEVSEVN